MKGFIKESNEDCCCNVITMFQEEEVLSQKSSAVLSSGVWGRVVVDLGHELVNRINVRSVRSRGKTSRSLKVPIIALAIITIDASCPDPILTLADSTGCLITSFSLTPFYLFIHLIKGLR
jgi:hypothetical protein